MFKSSGESEEESLLLACLVRQGAAADVRRELPDRGGGVLGVGQGGCGCLLTESSHFHQPH